MIDTILDACREVLELNGDPQSPYWLASQMVEMRMWRASEHDVRAPRDDHTLHEDSDANDYTLVSCVICTGMCIYPHKSGRQDGY